MSVRGVDAFPYRSRSRGSDSQNKGRPAVCSAMVCFHFSPTQTLKHRPDLATFNRQSCSGPRVNTSLGSFVFPFGRVPRLESLRLLRPPFFFSLSAVAMPSSSFSSSSFPSLFSLLCLALTLSATLSSAASFPLARRVLSPSFNPSKSGLGSRPINAKAAAASRPRAVIPKKFWSRGEFDPSAVVENKKVKPGE
jgi:hypothetical protein